MSLEFIGVLGSAVLLKLTSSADDVVWLAKLLEGTAGRQRLTLYAVYIATLSLVALLALVLAVTGAKGFLALTGNEGWFSLVASVLLVVFAATVVRAEDEDADDASSSGTEPVAHFGWRVRDAFVIAFVGSIDELAVYTVALSTGEIAFLPLFLGTVIAAMLTLMVVYGVSGIHIVSRTLEAIPTWVVIALLGLLGIAVSAWELAH